jgi:predicted nuclease of predicted toxin-antitoxin system
VKFLVDTNLPAAVSAWLVANGCDAQHTSEIGLEQADDRVIWRHARAAGLCVITKDEDFVLMQAVDPAGPSVVWVRIGNAVKRIMIQRMAIAWPRVIAKLEQGERVVEVR